MIDFPKSFWQNCWTYKKGVQGEIKGAILAAGLGKRMDPLTVTHLPKPLFPLGGKVPMAEIWVRKFVESGISDISMNLCVLSDTIKRHFKEGSKFACNITYVEEETPSGTLGGVCKQALGKNAKLVDDGEKAPNIEEFKGSTIIAPSGDIVSDFDSELIGEMYEMHKKKGAAFSMILVPVAWDRRKDFGTVVLDNVQKRDGMVSSIGRVKEFVEKDPDSPSNLNNGSIYIIEMDFLKAIDPLRTSAKLNTENPFYDFGKHLFPAMLGKLPYVSVPKDATLWGMQYDGNWFDVGRKRDYINVNKALFEGKIKLELPYEKLPWGYLGTNVTIDFSKVTIIPPVIIGNNCIVEPGSTIGPNAVIGDDWVIENGSMIKDSVLWERYGYYTKSGNEISKNNRKLVDRHEVREGVKIETCIVTGGRINKNISEKTVNTEEDGSLSISDIDYVPSGPRA